MRDECTCKQYRVIFNSCCIFSFKSKLHCYDESACLFVCAGHNQYSTCFNFVYYVIIILMI